MIPLNEKSATRKTSKHIKGWCNYSPASHQIFQPSHAADKLPSQQTETLLTRPHCTSNCTQCTPSHRSVSQWLHPPNNSHPPLVVLVNRVSSRRGYTVLANVSCIAVLQVAISPPRFPTNRNCRAKSISR